jgi:soluble lytic murein transglycosylase-like protein
VRKDARYQLVFVAGDAARLDRWREVARAQPPLIEDPPAAVLPRRFAGLYGLRGYPAVQPHLESAARAHQVDYALLKAVVAVESSFDADAVSSKGAVGLMQLLPDTARRYGVVADSGGRGDSNGRPARSVRDKLTDPGTNIDAGARHLAYLLRLFNDDPALALAAYNAGEGAVRRAGNQVPDYPQTQVYVKTVMRLYDLFHTSSSPSSSGTPATSATPAQPPPNGAAQPVVLADGTIRHP